MAYAYWMNNRWNEVAGAFTIGGLTYQAGYADTALADERARLKIKPIIEPGDPPADEMVIGSEIVDTSDGPARHWTTEPYTVDEAAAIMWDRAKVARDAACDAGAATPFGRVDTTQDSKIDMAGAVLMAVLAKQTGQPFSIDWTMADNTVQTLDADGMIALGLAAGKHRQLCQNVGTAIRAKIDQAAAKKGATAASIFGINVTSGYDGAGS